MSRGESRSRKSKKNNNNIIAFYTAGRHDGPFVGLKHHRSLRSG